MKRRLICLFVIMALVLSLTACGSKGSSAGSSHSSSGTGSNSNSGNNNNSNTNASDSSNLLKSISMSANDSDFSITRVQKSGSENTPMGPKDTWTIFVYMCGSDLESNWGSATDDLNEMISSVNSDNVKFVVQTGGAKKWQNDVISSGKLTRLLVSNNTWQVVDEKNDANMGLVSTLTDFLKWGVSTYPAEHMGVVFWDHGGGFYSGVCFDEKYNDSLTPREIDAALLSVSGQMTDKFEFIGFDACIMASLEMANILASYADYMYASQESEPGSGWNYVPIGEYLCKNPGADGQALGKKLTDGYYDSVAVFYPVVTFSIVDLAKIDNVLKTFHAYSKDIYNLDPNDVSYSKLTRKLLQADDFGGNTSTEGYTNYIDLVGVIEAGKDVSSSAKAAIDAVNEAVIYKRNGSDHAYACGLSTYYPYRSESNLSSSEFAKIATTPFYLGFVDRILYGKTHSSSISGYDNTALINSWGDFSYLEEADGNLVEVVDNTVTENFTQPVVSDESPILSNSVTSKYFDDGTFGIVVDKNSIGKVASVQADVGMIDVASDGTPYLYILGMMTNIRSDWDKGEFGSMFDATWFAIPDGQAISVFISSECEGYDVYAAPIELNDKPMLLRVVHDYSNSKLYLDGAYDANTENGMPAKNAVTLKAGDVIKPVYALTNCTTKEMIYVNGDPYTYDGNPALNFEPTNEAIFSYQYSVYDVFGNFVQSDLSFLVVKGGNVTYFNDLQDAIAANR